MALLSMLSILIYQATVRGFDVNDKLSREADDMLSIAVALQTLESDVSQIYSPIFLERPADSAAIVAGSSIATPPTLFWSPRRDDGLRRGRLVGTREKLTFLANSNRKIQKDAKDGELVGITWEIVQNKSGTYALKRSVEYDIYDYEDRPREKARSFVMIDNLSSGQFSFYRKKQDAWEDGWDSEGPAVQPGLRYPDILRLKLEGPDPTNPSVPMQWSSEFEPNLNFNGLSSSSEKPPTPKEGDDAEKK